MPTVSVGIVDDSERDRAHVRQFLARYEQEKHQRFLIREYASGAAKLAVVRSREVVARIESRGGRMLRQRGSHRFYEVAAGAVTARTTVPQSSRDLPKGTLARIERDLEPALGKGWLRR
ncbi:MAG: type II toxin-antitoxin system HicA family toxin [Bifidobacteriaceae bacterium]|jgi:predicted RNA binding protein YcfA (HicA-like mRNA interferase family)|nr:type II toxin-antitoxin system HicA family toxin [Bifidobacteriaceae bacterium]